VQNCRPTAFRIEHAQAHLLLLADLDQQCLLTLARRARQRLCRDLGFDPGKLVAFREQLFAIGIEVEHTATEQYQGQDIDREDAPGE